MHANFGADAVGMSTAQEALAAHAAGEEFVQSGDGHYRPIWSARSTTRFE